MIMTANHQNSYHSSRVCGLSLSSNRRLIGIHIVEVLDVLEFNPNHSFARRRICLTYIQGHKEALGLCLASVSQISYKYPVRYNFLLIYELLIWMIHTFRQSNIALSQCYSCNIFHVFNQLVIDVVKLPNTFTLGDRIILSNSLVTICHLPNSEIFSSEICLFFKKLSSKCVKFLPHIRVYKIVYASAQKNNNLSFVY